MVHSVPTSVTTPLSQQGAQQASARLLLQKSTSEDSTTSEAPSPHFASFAERGVRGGGGGERLMESPQDGGGGAGGGATGGGGVRLEQEESIHTCTKAIASLCIDSEELAEREGGGGGREGGGRAASSFPAAPPPDSHQQQRSPSVSTSPHPSPSPPQGPRIQHFSGPELRPSYPSAPAASSSSPHTPGLGSDALPPSAASKLVKPERNGEDESTRRSKDAS